VNQAKLQSFFVTHTGSLVSFFRAIATKQWYYINVMGTPNGKTFIENGKIGAGPEGY
jgi:hypothetical protein